MSIQDLTANLDLKQNLNIYTTCKQFDNLNLILSIYDRSISVDLTNYNVRLKAMKSDKVPLIQEHVGITPIGNVVTIEADEQLTTTSGKTLVELQFINKTTGKKKATFNLVLIVVPSTLEVDATISTATYTLLQELENKLDQASDFLENIDEAITANTNLVDSTNTANETKEVLDSSNTTALSTKSALDTSNTNAINTKNALDISKTNADNSKAALDTSKTNADASKVALDSSIEEANTFAEAHQDIENLVNQVNSNTTQLSDIPNQTYITEKAKIVDVNNSLALKADKTYTDTQLNTKRDKTMPIGVADISGELQAQIAGTAPVANSIPAAGSVTVSTLDSGTIKKFDTNFKVGETILDYAYKTATQSVATDMIRIINKPFSRGVIKHLTLDSGLTSTPIYIFRKINATDYYLLSTTNIITKIGLFDYDVTIDLPEEGLYIGVFGLNMDLQYMLSPLPQLTYVTLELSGKNASNMVNGTTYNPILRDSAQLNFGIRLQGDIIPENSINGYNFYNEVEGNYKLDWASNVTLIDYNSSGTRGQIADDNTIRVIPIPIITTMTNNKIVKLSIDTDNILSKIVILRKIVFGQYQVISYNEIVTTAGLHDYDVNISLPESGLYIGMIGGSSAYYQGTTSEYYNTEDFAIGSGNLKVNDIFLPSPFTAFKNNLAIKAIGVASSNNAVQLEEKLRDIDGNISDLNSINNLNKKWVVAGDSISVNTLHTSVFYHTILAKKYNLEVNNLAVSATGWLSNGYLGIAGGYDSLKGHIDNGLYNGLDFDFMTIMYGTNDWGVESNDTTMGSAPLGTINDSVDTLSIYGGIKYCLNKLITMYPTKGFGVISTPPRAEGYNVVNGKGVTLLQVNKAIEDVCNLYNVPFINILNNTRLRPSIDANKNEYYTDVVHLRQKGHEVLARQLDNWITTL